VRRLGHGRDPVSRYQQFRRSSSVSSNNHSLADGSHPTLPRKELLSRLDGPVVAGSQRAADVLEAWDVGANRAVPYSVKLALGDLLVMLKQVGAVAANGAQLLYAAPGLLVASFASAIGAL
jgi:hypothetical protein